ncbi:MAG: biotin/lipoyl-binding protein [Epsilonproteobacteria bacterium]|nr:biotin/lipoyl-binding protein [Campylobacterota bacterium]
MKILQFIIAITLAGLLALGGIMLIKKRRAEDAHSQTAKIYPIVVKTYQAKEHEAILSLPYLAEVKNDKEVTINSKFAGKILYIAKLGDKVRKGDILVKIDNTDLKAKLKEVNSQINSLKNKLNAEKLNLNNLLATHKRTKQLLDVKMASIEEYQNEQNKIANLKASIKADTNNIQALKANKASIINNMSYTLIKSPIDGVISAKFLNKDDNVFMAKPILKISANNGNYLFISLANDKKEIIYKNKFYPLIPLHTSINGLLNFKAIVNDKNLINGQKVNIQVVEFHKQAKTYPYDSILSINNQNYVFDISGGVHKVNIIAKGENEVVLQNAPDEVIVAKPDILLKIKAGYPITIK